MRGVVDLGHVLSQCSEPVDRQETAIPDAPTVVRNQTVVLQPMDGEGIVARGSRARCGRKGDVPEDEAAAFVESEVVEIVLVAEIGQVDQSVGGHRVEIEVVRERG